MKPKTFQEELEEILEGYIVCYPDIAKAKAEILKLLERELPKNPWKSYTNSGIGFSQCRLELKKLWAR